MCLLNLQIFKHGNSIYFMHDILVCFPKSGHNGQEPLGTISILVGHSSITTMAAIAWLLISQT